MKTLVISGAHSNVGKTTLALTLHELLPGSVVVKIGHAPAKTEKAGGYYHSGTPYAQIAARHADAEYLIIESNQILDQLTPECTIYLGGKAPKPSAVRAVARADIIRGQLIAAGTLTMIARRLGISLGTTRKLVWLAGARPEPTTAVILAGGQSTRMGTDKALLAMNGGNAVECVERQLAPVVDHIVLSVSRENHDLFGSRRIVIDPTPGQGPLMGIASALAQSPTDINLVIACDIPRIDPRTLGVLLSQIDDHDIAVPSFRAGQTEPLFGVYRSRVVPEARTLLAGHRRRVAALFERCRTAIVPLNDSSWYHNLNTAQEYRNFMSRAKERQRAVGQ